MPPSPQPGKKKLQPLKKQEKVPATSDDRPQEPPSTAPKTNEPVENVEAVPQQPNDSAPSSSPEGPKNEQPPAPECLSLCARINTLESQIAQIAVVIGAAVKSGSVERGHYASDPHKYKEACPRPRDSAQITSRAREEIGARIRVAMKEAAEAVHDEEMAIGAALRKISPVSALVSGSQTINEHDRRLQDCKAALNSAAKNGELQNMLRKRELELAQLMAEYQTTSDVLMRLRKKSGSIEDLLERMTATESSHKSTMLQLRKRQKACQRELNEQEKVARGNHSRIEDMKLRVQKTKQRTAEELAALRSTLDELNAALSAVEALIANDTREYQIKMEARRARYQSLTTAIGTFNPVEYRRTQESLDRAQKDSQEKLRKLFELELTDTETAISSSPKSDEPAQRDKEAKRRQLELFLAGS